MNSETIPHWERPMAAKGLTSYRYHIGGNRYVMIGATNSADAIREANRSLTDRDAAFAKLDVWDGSKYVPVNPQTGTID